MVSEKKPEATTVSPAPRAPAAGTKAAAPRAPAAAGARPPAAAKPPAAPPAQPSAAPAPAAPRPAPTRIAARPSTHPIAQEPAHHALAEPSLPVDLDEPDSEDAEAKTQAVAPMLVSPAPARAVPVPHAPLPPPPAGGQTAVSVNPLFSAPAAPAVSEPAPQPTVVAPIPLAAPLPLVAQVPSPANAAASAVPLRLDVVAPAPVAPVPLALTTPVAAPPALVVPQPLTTVAPPMLQPGAVAAPAAPPAGASFGALPGEGAGQQVVRRSKSDFDVAWVVKELHRLRLISLEKAKELVVKAPQLAAKVVADAGGDAKYEPTAVEVVAQARVALLDRPSETLDQDRITGAIAQAVGVPYHKIDPLRLDMPLITRTLSRPFAQRYALLPLSLQNDVLNLAVANPFDHDLFAEVARLTGMRIRPFFSTKSDILRAISDTYGFKASVARAVDDAVAEVGVGNFEQLVVLSKGNTELQAEDKPVIQAVEYLLRYAFDQRASDIHLEPKRENTVMRLRIDGVLHNAFTLPRAVHAPIAARLKLLSRMDITEKRRPQDGRIKTQRDGVEIELRVSTLPTAFGEKMVLRIFDPETMTTLDQLGFDGHEQRLFESWIGNPHGLILVTGPTGSGKTTTLYAALRSLAGQDVNVTTIEDPIEMVWEGFNQVQVQSKLDLDFASALRTILRQDPDIIMVGEIRDGETASNAIQCALTGHLVLSTLHTNDSVGAVARLRDLGVPSFLLASSLLGVMAQRLVRTNCPACKEPVELTAEEITSLQSPLPLIEGGVQLSRGKGCVKCRGTGYRGRTGVFEMFHVTRDVREAIAGGKEGTEIEDIARAQGMRRLREAAVLKLAKGVSSFDEVIRMTSADM